MLVTVVRAIIHPTKGWYTFGDPYVTTDDAVVANHGFAAQDGSAGINHHIVFNGWVSFGGGEFFFDTQGPQGNSLIYFYIVANV